MPDTATTPFSVSPSTVRDNNRYVRIGTRYRPQRVDQNYDAIVIGSGIGGLTTAALLSQQGYRVVVLEQHYTAGGFTHAYANGGYEWDVGVHYIGDVGHPRAALRRLFDQITEGRLKWAPMDACYDRIWIGEQSYDLVAGRQEFKASLLQHFPQEGKVLDRYLELLDQVNRAMPLYTTSRLLPDLISRAWSPLQKQLLPKFLFQTTSQVLDTLTDNPQLKAVLAGQWGDYGLPPQQSSFLMHATVARHYLRGAFYPVGGASRIAASILPTIQQGGGDVFTYADVAEILVRRGKALGVRMADGKEIFADRIISNAGFQVTMEQLLDDQARKQADYAHRRQQVETSMSHQCLYIGLNATDDQLELPKTNYWLYPSADYEGDTARFLENPEAELPLVYISFPSRKDPDWPNRHPGKSTIEIVAPAPYQWFSQWQDKPWGKRGADYEALKAQWSERLLAHLYRHFPQTRPHVDFHELSTPLSTRYFCRYQHGEIYGLNHTPQRFQTRWLGPRTPIRNLYLTGQDALTGGVGGALIGGVFAAAAVTGGLKAARIMKPLVA